MADGNGVLGGLFGHIKDKLVFLSVLDEVVLWGEENVWYEPGNPSGEQDNEIIAFLFVHGFHDCIKFLCDGWVVAILPICHEIFP